MRKRKLLPGALILCLALAGCSISPLARNTAAFSNATNLLVDNTQNAYRTAVRLNEDAQASLLVARYDTAQPMDPHSIRPLIDEKGLQARTDVLDGLRTYAQTIADLAGGVSSPKLDEAATASGANLKSLGDALSSSTPIHINITPTEANATSTALKALGDFLVNRQTKSSVPKVIREMDPHIDTLSKLLTSDIDILRDQTGRDYEQILAQQDSFIRHAAPSLSATERRTEIQRLPRILADKKATDDMFVDLQTSLNKLVATHHALAAAATSKNNPSLQARIADLRAAAERLATFYEDLSNNSK
ncbi:hypothetical protein [Edaphobacter albus]|uniref:hypothetical protein n=1 Tax=Edaphobacter sp. 4G125 TaxID=2763071 RepID=UPI0016490451|nr:hypothetical protein [Edaphobacter sp. 4G125]QNI37557.1 hypothetical protein H7846_04435 [Edaphobacter sp. 4G125]